MKNLADAQTYFESSLQSVAEDRDLERRSFNGFWKIQMKKRAKISGLAIVLGFVCLSISEGKPDLKPLQYIGQALAMGSFLFIIASAVLVGMSFKKKFQSFQKKYRATVVVPFLEYISPELKHQGEREVDMEPVYQSLVTPIYNKSSSDTETRYWFYDSLSDDSLEGEFGGHRGILHAFRFVDYSQGASNFDHMGGLYFRAELGRKIEGRVLVEREVLEGAVGSTISNAISSIRKFSTLSEYDPEGPYHKIDQDLKVVRFDSHPDFEAKFRVKATSDELARELLTDKRIQWLIDSLKDLQNGFRVCFYENYVAVYFPQYCNHSFTVAYRDIGKSCREFLTLEAIYKRVEMINHFGSEFISN